MKSEEIKQLFEQFETAVKDILTRLNQNFFRRRKKYGALSFQTGYFRQ